MVTVADILALPAFTHVELLTPLAGSESRLVRNVGILDCTPDINGYTNYFPGEFILTNMGFADGNPSLSERSLLTMIGRNVAGIAVKTVYGPLVSDAVLDSATKMGIPIYLYEGSYHEMVAYQALDLIRRDEQEDDKTALIEELIKPHEPDNVSSSMFSIASCVGAAVQVVAFSPKDANAYSPLATLASLKGILGELPTEYPPVADVRIKRYHNRLLVFVSFYSPDPFANGDRRDATDAVVDIVASARRYHCGVSERLRVEEGDICIRQALAALEEALIKGERRVDWASMRWGSFASAARGDRLFQRASAAIRSKIETYDRSYETELLSTADAFVMCNGEISSTADFLHQHPNTIRYRLRRIKDLLEDPSLTDRRLYALLLLMQLA